MLSKNLTGTGVAIVTPFRPDRTVDYTALQQLCQFLAGNGADYIVALGTTGESTTLTTDEKKKVTSCIIEAIGGKLPVVIGIGGNDTAQIVNNIRNNDFTGVSALLSVAPYYNKPSQEGIYQHYKAIAAVSPVPVILYNVPGRTGINMKAKTTVRLARDFENIVAIKEACSNLVQVMEIMKDKPKDFLVISGDDALTLPMISLGAVGAISVVANAFPKQFAGIIQAAMNGDLKKANKFQYKLLDMMDALFEEGSPSGIKAVLHYKGLIDNVLRLPLVPVTDKHYQKLARLTKKIGN